jgi:6-phosphogluconolactonase
MKTPFRRLTFRLEDEVSDAMSVIENAYDSLEEAARALAAALRDCIDNAVSARGRALIAVSGGNTPRFVFEHLSKNSIDWKRVTMTLTDERWVPSSHEDSNEALVQTCLMNGAAESATFVPLYGEERSPELGLEACEQRLQNLPGPLDAAYLGMGPDGHFASLFPGEPLEDGNRLCLAIPATKMRAARMSLSLPMLIDAKHLMLLYSGAEKHETYMQAKAGGGSDDIPLSHLIARARSPLTVFRGP